MQYLQLNYEEIKYSVGVNDFWIVDNLSADGRSIPK
jgi:hypothetical protein